VFWAEELLGRLLTLRLERSDRGSGHDFDLLRFGGRVSVLIGADGRQQIVLKASPRILVLSVRGASVFDRPLCARFVTEGLGAGISARASKAFGDLAAFLSQRPAPPEPGWTTRKTSMRDGLIALDGIAAGASYRDIARVRYGASEADVVWHGRRWTPKDRVRKGLARSRALMMGGYRRLLAR
jgi:hypothetical protein